MATESNVQITAGAGTPVDVFTLPSGNQRQAVVIADPGNAANTVVVGPDGALYVRHSDQDVFALILLELRRHSVLLSLLVNDEVSDSDLNEVSL